LKPAGGATRGRVLAGLAGVLLLLGILFDAGFVQPRIREIHRLRGELTNLRTQAGQQGAMDDEVARLAKRLGVDDLNAAFSLYAAADPVTFLGRMIDEAHLTRLELSTQATTNVGQLRRTKFSFRVIGSYGRLMDLVNRLERSPRLATVDALSIMPAVESPGLEGRFDISIYDPLVGRKP
jgi:hypothetical protein